MAAKLIQPTEAIEVQQLCCLLYGQPGSKKSSMLQTADEPITMAFDPGIYRAYGRKTAVVFETWADVIGFDYKPYQTVGVDTAGMCLDKLAAAIIADNPKHGNRMGGLSLQGYGQLKAQFAAWVGSLRQAGKSIVFTAHEKAEKLGDDVYYCPDIVGGSYNTLMNHCDIVGYLHFSAGKRVIDFSPTDQWMAKTPPCNWGTIALPDFGAEPKFLAKLLDQARNSMGQISAESAQIVKQVEAWQKRLSDDPAEPELNQMALECIALPGGPAKLQQWHLIAAYAAKAGYLYNKKLACWQKKEEVAA